MKLTTKVIRLLGNKDMYVSELAIDTGGHRLILPGVLQPMEQLGVLQSYMLGRTKMYKLKEQKVLKKKEYSLEEYVKIEEVVEK